MKIILHSTFSCGSFQSCVLMGRFWCSVIKLSEEGLILIKSEAAALVQSLTQLELFCAGKGVAGSRDGVQPVLIPRINSEFVLSDLASPPTPSDVSIHIFIYYYIHRRQNWELMKALRACTVLLKL